MRRREFLKTMQSISLLTMSGGVSGLSLFLSPVPVRADVAPSKTPKFFVMVRCSLGWDVTLGLDPQVHTNGSEQSDIFIEYRPDEILQAGGLKFGPACAPLVPYASDLCVVNGVFMSNSNVSHDANLDYMATGNSEGHMADLPVALNGAIGGGPYGVVFSNNLKRANIGSVSNMVGDILTLRNAMNLAPLENQIVKVKSSSPFRRAEENLIHTASIRGDLIQRLSGLGDEINAKSDDTIVDSARKDAATMVAAFASGAANQGLVDLFAELDTHADHPVNHLRAQTSVWNAVANMLRIFKSIPYENGSMLDQTCFMVISEFSRTPALNTGNGKDHNPLTNSVLLAGAGLRGTTVGASQVVRRQDDQHREPRHVGGLINYRTGEVAQSKEQAAASKDFQFIYPENVVATVLDLLQVDRRKFANIDPATLALNVS